MKTLICYASTEHENTKRVAESVKDLGDIDLLDIGTLKEGQHIETEGYDLLGFGSGIFAGHFAKNLKSEVEALPDMTRKNKKAFAFSTGSFDNFSKHKELNQIFEKKGLQVIDGFTCKGYNTFPLFKVVGGLAKGHPNEEDFEKARREMKRILSI